MNSTTSQTASSTTRAKIYAQIGRYQRAWRWLSSDAYGRYKSLTVSATFLMFAGLALRLGALGLLTRYIHILELGRPLHFLSITVADPQRSYELLLAIAGGTLILFLGACFTQYMSEIQMLRMSVLYEEHCAKRAIFGIGRYGHHPAVEEWRSKLRYLLSIDARFCGTIARLGLKLLLPLVAIGVTFSILIRLEPALTLSLAVLVLLAAPILYRASVRGANHSRILERNTFLANAEKRRLITVTAGSLDTASHNELLNKEFRKGSLRAALDAYLGRLRTTIESTFITSVLMAFAIFLLLLQQGASLLERGSGWGQLATYLIILRLFLSYLTQAAALLASINRTYPQLSRYMSFSRCIAHLVESGAPHAPASSEIWRKMRGNNTTEVDDDIVDDDA